MHQASVLRCGLGQAVVLVALLLCIVAGQTQAWAQARIPRIGVLALNEVDLQQLHQRMENKSFATILADRGWVLGKNVKLEPRFARSEDSRFDDAARELVQLKVDIILALSAPATRAAHAATKTIPIVAGDYTNDPVAAGFAESYAKPGKNITGVFLDAPELAGKWIELLKAIVPNLKRLAVLWDPAPGDTHLKALKSAAQSFGLQMQVQEVRTPSDFEKAFAAFRGRAQALIVLPSPMTWTHGARLAELALEHKLPAASIFPEFAQEGGAISYGPNGYESVERNAAQVAKILDGAKAGDVPIERPTKFEFLINMKTMKTLGLKVPDALLLTAEQVRR